MSFIVVITERAAREIEDAAQWWARERNVDEAERWYAGIRAAIADLAEFPNQCAIAPERRSVPYEIRELFYGLGSAPTHRIVFTILRQTVVVLTVRHTARPSLQPGEL